MIYQRLVRSARHRGHGVAICDPTSQVTFAHLLADANRLGRLLAGMEHPEQPVAILLPAGAAFATAFFATQQAHRTALPLNFLLPAAQLTRILTDSRAGLILASQAFKPLASNLPVRTIYLDEGIGQVALDIGKDESGTSAPAAPDAQRPAVLLYTSGSTGRPKGVMLSAANLLADVDGCIEAASLKPGQKFLGVLPMFHAFGLTGMLLCPAALGATVCYLPRFSAAGMVQAVREHSISVVMAVPSMYGAIVRLKDASPADLASLHLAISGGEPLPPELAKQFEARFGHRLYEGYGLTETSPVVSLNLPGAFRPGSAGKPLPNVRVRIVDDAGAPCPPGVEGEIVVHGPTVMMGYLNLPAETAAVFSPDGGLKTGDVGRLDGDGFLTITGRKKELIIIAGENVWPAEVERVLASHPKVALAAVVGRTDPLRGQSVVAYVKPADAADPPSQTELRSHCRERLPGFKVPRRVVVVEELPLSPTGKVLKHLLPDSLRNTD